MKSSSLLELLHAEHQGFCPLESANGQKLEVREVFFCLCLNSVSVISKMAQFHGNEACSDLWGEKSILRCLLYAEYSLF